MTRPSKPLIQALVGLFALTYAAEIAVRGGPLSLEVLAPAGVAATAGTALVWLLDNYLWRAPLVGRVITSRPDLRGTWGGTLRTTWVNPETGEVRAADPEIHLVIRQRYWSLRIDLLTRESASTSMYAMLTQSEDGPFQIVATYRNVPRPAVRSRSVIHLGSMMLTVSEKPSPRLAGDYFTDRATTGELSFERHSRTYVADWTSAARLLGGEDAPSEAAAPELIRAADA